MGKLKRFNNIPLDPPSKGDQGGCCDSLFLSLLDFKLPYSKFPRSGFELAKTRGVAVSFRSSPDLVAATPRCDIMRIRAEAKPNAGGAGYDWIPVPHFDRFGSNYLDANIRISLQS